MEIVTDVSAALAVYGALIAASVWFNRRIDGMPPAERPDGLTALWVALGVAYTCIGATMLVWLGWPVLALLAERFGAQAGALGVLAILLSAFVASGMPMLWGDMRRSYGLRTIHESIEVARDELRGARSEIRE